ncbi:MAG: glycosyltransferase [Bifidobacteriaceae bacterium]|jgi:GT2 family glycosyltransferase|nr:glycosyltransferase [Bifidobacteriaceae bacterium]
MKVVAVVVAYNRRDLLLQALDGLAAQTRPVDRIVVVDNASTDGSGAAAKAHPAQPEVLTLRRNTGGAGGFAAGLAHAALNLEAGAVWLMDDDTVPQPTALEELLRAWEACPTHPAAVASRVVWTDGRDHPMNTPRNRLFAPLPMRVRAAAAGARPIRTASFVSLLVDADLAVLTGLPKADYFIWNDDFDFTARLLRHREGLLVPASVAVHHTTSFAGALDEPGDRFFYEVRNKVWTFTRSHAFGPIDLLAYGAFTLLGWVRLLVRSEHRLPLVRGLAFGLFDGLRRSPRPTERVLAGLGPVSAEVAAACGRARAVARRRAA